MIWAMFLFYLTKKNDLEEEIIHLFHEVFLLSILSCAKLHRAMGQLRTNLNLFHRSTSFIKKIRALFYVLLRQSMQTSKQLLITTFITFQPTFTCSKSNKNMWIKIHGSMKINKCCKFLKEHTWPYYHVVFTRL